MLNLVWVNTFLALMQTRSFQLSADQLGIAQPTVSQHMQKLEEKLGLVLFHRTRSGCTPTPEALRFHPYAQSLVRLNERALSALQGGRLRVGASSNIGIYLLPPLIKDYLQDRDPASFDLVIEANPAIADKLESGEIDIALLEWWDDRPGFAARCWKQEPLVVIVHPHHPWAQRSELTRADLDGAVLLGGESGSGTGRLLQGYFADASAMPRTSYQLGSTEAVKQSVKAGLGISLVMAAAVEEEVAFGSLRAITLVDPLNKPLYVVWRDNLGAQAGVPSFIEHLSLGLQAGEALAQAPH